MGDESDRPTPALTTNAVGITPEAAFVPLYVYYRGKDPFIDVAWVTAAVERRARWVASSPSCTDPAAAVTRPVPSSW